MKTRLLSCAFALLSILVSCQKQADGLNEIVSTGLVKKSFSVIVPETKSYLDNKTIKWSEGDIINVIGVTEDGTVGQYSFELTDGAGTKNGTFSGEVGENDVTFYALYPNLTINPTESDYTLSSGYLSVSNESILPKTQKAIADGFDPEFGIMTAVADDEGVFSFRHGMGFFKFEMGVDDVAKVTFSTTGNIRFGRRPVYNIEDGAVAQVNSGLKEIDLVPVDGGVFVKGNTYYLAFPPKQSNTGDLTIKYTRTDGKSAFLTTTAFSSIKLQPGVIYNIGCPPVSFTPSIKVTAPSKLEYDAISGSFAYDIVNPVDGVNVVAECTADWISNVIAADGTVTFDCTKNDGSDSAERTAVITLSYEGAGSVEVSVTQKKMVLGENHEHIFYYNSSKTGVNLTDGNSGSYFTATGTADLGGDYKISEWSINGYTSTKGVKLNSTGSVTFKTSATLTSTVQFFFIRRKSGDSTAKIQLVPEEGDAVVLDTPYDSIADSGVIELEKNMSYTIKQKEKEQAVLLVIVNETE